MTEQEYGHSVKITASKGLVSFLTEKIYTAKADRLNPIGIVIGATEYLKFCCELVQGMQRLPDIHMPEFQGLPLHIVPDSIITLSYSERDASRLSLGSCEEDIARRIKQ